MLHIVAVELHYTILSRKPPSPLRINDLRPLWSNPPDVWHNPAIYPSRQCTASLLTSN